MDDIKKIKKPVSKPADIMQMIRDSVVRDTFFLSDKFREKYFKKQKQKLKSNK